ncbi:hypothetical protein P4197_00010 [Pseudomonas aeruginosa]|nr:hypothetical protein [Pseudomonas aeruginosa]
MIAAGYELEPPPIPCTVRMRDVLVGMTDEAVALQPGELADQEPGAASQFHSGQKLSSHYLASFFFLIIAATQRRR